ncbi:hypothetical protein EVAR_46579_1 [Eumeta japonica]|uniref:Uncharacterized protein n=1 Tax=Eumeta variegata TaxID=151549 RepID=A0A4C1WRZ0_EUMVA|nr:hypothetical protein EVAR_46579_1 [Eumeta japonica]
MDLLFQIETILHNFKSHLRLCINTSTLLHVATLYSTSLQGFQNGLEPKSHPPSRALLPPDTILKTPEALPSLTNPTAISISPRHQQYHLYSARRRRSEMERTHMGIFVTMVKLKIIKGTKATVDVCRRVKFSTSRRRDAQLVTRLDPAGPERGLKPPNLPSFKMLKTSPRAPAPLTCASRPAAASLMYEIGFAAAVSATRVVMEIENVIARAAVRQPATAHDRRDKQTRP